MKQKLYFIGEDPDLQAIKMLNAGCYPEELMR